MNRSYLLFGLVLSAPVVACGGEPSESAESGGSVASSGETTSTTATTSATPTSSADTAGSLDGSSTGQASTGGEASSTGSTMGTSSTGETAVSDTSAEPGVSGTLPNSANRPLEVVSGAAYDDDGTLRIVLGTFAFGCDDVGSLGFSTPPGGVWVRFDPDDTASGRLWEAEEIPGGTQTNQIAVLSFEGTYQDFGDLVEGVVEFGDPYGATFVVPNCGAR